MSVPRIQREVVHLTDVDRLAGWLEKAVQGHTPGTRFAYRPWAAELLGRLAIVTREHNPHSPVASPRPVPGNTRRGSIGAEGIR